VSTDTCLIPKIIIEHGKNGFVGSTPEELRELTIMLLNDKVLAQEVGKAGRRTILDKFSQDRFVREWREIMEHTTHNYKGSS
jgi:glycosyltransferase involved in cell wall biosynthesis